MLRYGLFTAPREFNQHLDVLAQVALRAHQQEGGERAPPSDLRHPFLKHVLEGSRTNHTEAEEQDICAGVAEVPQLIELILRERQKIRN